MNRQGLLLNDVKGLERVEWGGREVVDGVEEEADYIFLSDPAELAPYRRFLRRPLLWAAAVTAPPRHYETLSSFKNAIYCIKYAARSRQTVTSVNEFYAYTYEYNLNFKLRCSKSIIALSIQDCQLFQSYHDDEEDSRL